jgi:hypothetical protein
VTESGTYSPFAALQRFGLLSEGILPCERLAGMLTDDLRAALTMHRAWQRSISMRRGFEDWVLISCSLLLNIQEVAE